MDKKIVLFLLICMLGACIPIKVAPSISDYRIQMGKRFKKGLPQRQVFLFEDSKSEGEFYAYVNTKFQLGHDRVYDDVPFVLNGRQYFMAIYETSKTNKALNFLPTLLDAGFQAALGNEPEEVTEPSEHTSEQYYIAIEVYSDFEKDCLAGDALSRQSVLEYLRNLKAEYLATHNYNEILFKDKGL
ncbi:MAG: hypothetical protein AB3N16_02140 [Flavobacteriaceae bacterium]